MLRESLLDDLDLPFTVVYGAIGRIHVAVNWRGLLTKPLLVSISDGNAFFYLKKLHTFSTRLLRPSFHTGQTDGRGAR